jgi:hypothetical protein
MRMGKRRESMVRVQNAECRMMNEEEEQDVECRGAAATSFCTHHSAFCIS